MQPPQTCVTVLLARAESDPHARLFLYDAVKAELERIAHVQLVGDRRNGMLDTQILFNDAFCRLYLKPSPREAEDGPYWRDRRHFYAIAAHVMRQIRIEYARRRKQTEELHPGIRDETPGHVERVEQSDLLLALDRELTALEGVDPEAARVFEVRYFGAPGDGPKDPADALLSEREAAAQLGLTRYVVRAAHHRACCFLIRRLPSLGLTRPGGSLP